MDARRGQVYTGIYEFDNDRLIVLEDQMAVGIEELGQRLHSYDRKMCIRDSRRTDRSRMGSGIPDRLQAGSGGSYRKGHRNDGHLSYGANHAAEDSGIQRSVEKDYKEV